MKLSSIQYSWLAVLLISIISYLPAQDITSGTVTYQAIARYDFQTLFAPWADQARDWVDSIPTESEGLVTLAFTAKNALYDTRADEQVLPKQLLDAQAKAAFMGEPSAELRKVYLNLETNEIVRQVEFMGRLFLVSDAIESKSWKLTNKLTKILDYTCMSAGLTQDGNSIHAYFTSEVPVPIGPDEFFGLPGLILAVEVNNATAFLAQSIDLAPLNEAVYKPGEGKKVTQEELDRIVQEKIREYNETKYEGNYHK